MISVIFHMFSQTHFYSKVEVGEFSRQLILFDFQKFQKQHDLEELEVPSSILIFGATLTGTSLYNFLMNSAIRRFAMKEN